MARKTVPITEEDKAEMLRLYVVDMNALVDISSKFGVSISTVSRILRGQGCPMRSRGNRAAVPVGTFLETETSFHDSIKETEPEIKETEPEIKETEPKAVFAW